MLYSHFVKYWCEIAFIFAAAVSSKVFDLEFGFRFDLFDELPEFAIDCCRGFVVNGDDPAPVCVFVKEGEK